MSRQMCANGCGRPCTVPAGRGTRRGSTARRRAKTMKGHDLCRECWSAALAAAEASAQAWGGRPWAARAEAERAQVVPGHLYPHPPVGQ